MKVRFLPQGIEREIKPGENVLHVAQDAGIYIKSVCRGVPNCAECRVRVVEGEFNVLPPGSVELALIGTAHFVDRRRLSCQLKCFGDISVDLTEQLEKQRKLLERNTRSRAGADELAIAREASVEETDAAPAAVHEGGAPTLAHDASADELRASGDGLGPDDHGGDDAEGERLNAEGDPKGAQPRAPGTGGGGARKRRRGRRGGGPRG